MSYTVRNVTPEAPGLWVSSDGEYEFRHVTETRPAGWQAFHRAYWNADAGELETRLIGTAPTLAAAMLIASQHYVTPAGQWDA